jgi:hypothetical protein
LFRARTDQDLMDLDRKLWGSWVDYLRLSMLHGGFYVS